MATVNAPKHTALVTSVLTIENPSILVLRSKPSADSYAEVLQGVTQCRLQILARGVGRDAAVDDEFRTRRVGGFVAGQIQDEVRDLDRLSWPAKRGRDNVVRKMRRHRCAYQA